MWQVKAAGLEDTFKQQSANLEERAKELGAEKEALGKKLEGLQAELTAETQRAADLDKQLDSLAQQNRCGQTYFLIDSLYILTHTHTHTHTLARLQAELAAETHCVADLNKQLDSLARQNRCGRTY